MSYYKNNLKLKVAVFLIITSLVFLLIPSNLVFGEGDNGTLESLQQAVNEANTNLEAVQVAADEANIILETAQAAVEEADAALGVAQTAVNETNAALEEAQTAVDEANAALASAGEDADLNVLQQVVNEANTNLEAAQVAADEANIILVTAQAAVEEADAALETAQTAVDETDVNLEEAQSAVDEAEAALEAYLATISEEPEEEILEASLAIEADPENVEPGGSVAYKIVIENTGNVALSDIEVLDKLPELVIFKSSSAGEFNEDLREVSYTIGSLEPGEVSEEEIIVSVPIVAKELQSLTNSVVISSEEINPINKYVDVVIVTSAEEESDEETTEDDSDEVEGSLSLSIIDDPDPVSPGQSVTYTINYANNGSVLLTGVILVDYVPEGTTLISVSEGAEVAGSSVTWQIGNLEPGQSGTASITIIILEDSPKGTIYTNIALIDSNEAEEVQASQDTLDPYSLPGGTQLFYVLGWAPDVLDLLDNDTGPGFDSENPRYLATASSGIHSVLSISNSGSSSSVYAYLKNYMDTSDFDPNNPDTYTVENGGKVIKITINPGEVYTIDDLIYKNYVPLAGDSSSGGNWGTGVNDWKVAGGDLLFISGGPVNVIRGFYPEIVDGSDGHVLAEFWNLYPTRVWDWDGTENTSSYTAPVGIDTYGKSGNTGSGQDFKYTDLVIQASEDNTRVTINDPVNGTTIIILNEGENYIYKNGQTDWNLTLASDTETMITATGSNMNTTQPGYIKVEDEIIHYTSMTKTASGTIRTYTFSGLTRGDLNTISATHSAGASVYRYYSINYSEVHQNLTISANKPIQAGLITSSGAQYDNRNYNLTADKLIGTDYYIPVDTGTGDRLYICGMVDGTIVEIWRGNTPSGDGTQPSHNPYRFTINKGNVNSNYIMPSSNTAVWITSTEEIQVLGAADSNEGDKDWGFQAISSEYYSSDYVTPYAPGRETTETLGTSTQTNGLVNETQTTIYADNVGSFSTSGYIKIDNEIIYYGNRTTSGSDRFYNCIRGQLSTTAAEHSDNTPVYQYSITVGDASWNPLYVTPVDDNTRVFVDWNGDGDADLPFTGAGNNYVDLNRYQIAKLFDTVEGDGDNGGAYIWAVNKNTGQPAKIVAYYGEQSSADSINGYDWGYSLIPLSNAFVYGLLLEKVADVDVASIGDTITYTFTVTNNGNATIYDININDAKITGPYNWGAADADSDGALDELAVGASASATATYVASAGDLPGPILNTATAAGSDTDEGDPNIESNPANESVELNALSPDISLTKTADPVTIYSGDLVTYSYKVENTGDDPLTGVTIVDGTHTVNVGTLAVDEVKEGTLYTANPTADVTNTATATGTDSLGGTVTDTATADVNVIAPDISLTKTADPKIATIGNTITYTYIIENTGDTILYDVTCVDTPLGIVTLTSGLTDEDGDLSDDDLAVGATASGSLTYTVMGDDLPGPLDNTASVVAIDPLQNEVTASGDASVDLYKTIVTMGSITLNKSGLGSKDIAGFTLYNSNGAAVTGEKKITGNGTVTWSNLPLDTYKIVETTVPSGYAKMADIKGIVVSSAKLNHSFNRTNTKTTTTTTTVVLEVLGIQELPFTGLNPIIPISGICIIITGLVMVILSISRRRKYSNLENK